MKRICIVLITAAIVFGLTSCAAANAKSGSSSASVSSGAAAAKQSASSAGSSAGSSAASTAQMPGIAVSKGSATVEITLPAILTGVFGTEITDEQKSYGFISAKKNSDGSVTYTIEKGKYELYMSILKIQVKKSLEKMGDGSAYKSITGITPNTSLTEVTVTAKQAEFEKSFDSFSLLGIGLQCMIYQVFNGISPDELSVVIHVKDFETKKVFKTVTYPDEFMD